MRVTAILKKYLALRPAALRCLVKSRDISVFFPLFNEEDNNGLNKQLGKPQIVYDLFSFLFCCLFVVFCCFFFGGGGAEVVYRRCNSEKCLMWGGGGVIKESLLKQL